MKPEIKSLTAAIMKDRLDELCFDTLTGPGDGPVTRKQFLSVMANMDGSQVPSLKEWQKIHQLATTLVYAAVVGLLENKDIVDPLVSTSICDMLSDKSASRSDSRQCSSH